MRIVNLETIVFCPATHFITLDLICPREASTTTRHLKLSRSDKYVYQCQLISQKRTPN